MKWLLLLCHIVFATENVNYLSILDQLEMANPIIIGELGYLRNPKMFHLMKNVMTLNQSICLTTTITNNTLQRSPGIIFKTNARATSKFQDQITSAHVNKPWIIIDKPPKKYSPIDVPLYFLENEILWEHYELKSMRFHNSLGRLDGEQFVWNQNISPNFFERRGNFYNITLFGMTDTETTYNQLPADRGKTKNPSKEIFETYEVKANMQQALMWPSKPYATKFLGYRFDSRRVSRYFKIVFWQTKFQHPTIQTY